MEASYLRVKNQARFQHYDPTERRPPWIKLYNDLLGDADEFMRLDESEQWQLVRIWMVASRSSSCTRDEDGKIVPVVANDATTLQRSIMSVRKVPLAKFIRDGWLIPVAEDELLPPDEMKRAKRRRDSGTRPRKSDSASASDSTIASTALRGRELEVPEEVQDLPGRQFVPDPAIEANGLPFETAMLTARLIAAIGDHADPGTAKIITTKARDLPPASLAKVVESLEQNRPRDRAAYAVAALRSETEERSVA